MKKKKQNIHKTAIPAIKPFKEGIRLTIQTKNMIQVLEMEHIQIDNEIYQENIADAKINFIQTKRITITGVMK